MTDEQNARFMKDPRRVAAQKELDDLMQRLREEKTMSAQTVLVTIPQLIKKISKAYEKLQTVEATIEREIEVEDACGWHRRG